MQGGNAASRSIESFRGDIQAMSDLVQQSWAENDQALLYTPEFLASMLDYPAAGADLAPSLYEGPEPMGFAAAFPRSAVLNGKPLNLVVSSFLSVAPKYKRAGMGGVLLGELIKRSRAAGYAGMIQYCIEGGPMNAVVLGLTRAMRIPTQHVFAVSYLSRMLLPKKAPAEPTADEGPAAAAALMALSPAMLAAAPLARTWTPAEATWQCCDRVGAVAVAAEGGRGVLTGYVMQIAGGAQPKCLFVDDVLWGDLGPAEREALVKRLLDRAAGAGARLAVVPRLGCFDPAPFEASHFKPSQRILHAYLSLWNGDALPGGDLPSLYMDVF